MADKELVHRLAMNFLAHSSSEAAYFPSEAVAYSGAVVYSEAVAYSEAVVYFPCEVVVRSSSEAVDPSVEAVDHNCRMMEILPMV